MIPADKWPEGAVILTWDSDGTDLYLYPSSHQGGWRSERSNIPMPAGHDWRVPVMRPTVKESLTADLEQFRDLVHTSFTEGCIGIEYREQLLALIDGQKGVE